MSLAQAIRRIRQRAWSDRAVSEFARDADDALTDAQTRINRLEWRAGYGVVDFGDFPGDADALARIDGQSGIESGSLVQCWIAPRVTEDHSEDEHAIEAIDVRAQGIVPGAGFTVRARSTDGGLLYGKYSFGWRWS